MKTFGGKVLVLDRTDINTDEIIPAKYLTENSKAALKPYLLEDLKLPGFDPQRDIAGKAAVLTGANFGCGSSREHAPWALEVNGIHAVIAPGFELIAAYAGTDVDLAIDVAGKTLTFTGGGKARTVPFALSGFDEALVQAGGWVEYADKKY